MTQNADTGVKAVKAGLVGRGIGQSRTPAMHMGEGRAQGIDFTYSIFDMDDPSRKGQTVTDILDAAEGDGYAGLNVTFPFKIEVIEYVDELSDNAAALGAVNTVVFGGDKRYGHNTDLWGFGESFRQGMAGAATGEMLLLGAGGAGMAVAHALKSFWPRTLWIYDTDAERAARLIDNLEARFGNGIVRPAESAAAVADRIDGVVNATPVGMTKLPGCPFPKQLLRPDLWVADIVYFPLETELLAAARAAGCRVLPGSGMAVFQAVRAFELFTGRTPDPARMRATFESLGR